MAPKLLVVIGITGNQGGSVARVFLKEPGWKVRGLTRDVDSSKASALRELGAELVAGNLDDVSSLERAFRGAHAIFAVTDFWQFIFDPSTPDRAAKAGKPLNEFAAELEIQQGKNIVDAAAKVLAEEGILEKSILSTLSNTRKLTGGEITENWHFDGKAIFTEYLRDTYKDLTAKTSYLQMGMFLENMLRGLPFTTPTKRLDGSFFLLKPPGQEGNHPIPFVHSVNDTGPLVRGLVYAPSGQTLLGYCRLLTWPQFLDTWTRSTGAKLEQVEATREELATKVPGFILEELIASFNYHTKWGWTGGEEGVVGPSDVGVKQQDLLDLEKWIAEQRWGGPSEPPANTSYTL